MNINLDIKQKQRFRNFVSGLTAGVVSVTVCNPLDITRTRLNLIVSTNIIIELLSPLKNLQEFYSCTENNLDQRRFKRTLFRYINILMQVTEQMQKQFRFSILFYFRFMSILRTFVKDKIFQSEYLTSSVIAGSFCNIATNPIWVIRTRVMAQALHLQHRQYPTSQIFKIMNLMVIQEGISSLFKLVSASVLGVSNAVIYFFIYENFKQKFVQQQNKTFNSFYVFSASIIAKRRQIIILVIASTATYPFIVARTIMQDHRAVQKGELIKMSSVFEDVYKKYGIKGFYAGLKPDLLRLLPSNTIVFLVYEFMKRKIKIGNSN